MFYGDEYDAATGIIHKSEKRLREHVAPLDARALQDPHIRFFSQRNPREGDSMLALFPATLENVRFYLRRRLMQAAGWGQRPS